MRRRPTSIALALAAVSAALGGGCLGSGESRASGVEADVLRSGSLRQVAVTSRLGTVRPALIRNCAANIGGPPAVVAPPCGPFIRTSRHPVLALARAERTLTVVTGEGASTVALYPTSRRLAQRGPSLVDALPVDRGRQRWRVVIPAAWSRATRLHLSTSPLTTDSGYLQFELRLRRP